MNIPYIQIDIKELTNLTNYINDLILKEETKGITPLTKQSVNRFRLIKSLCLCHLQYDQTVATLTRNYHDKDTLMEIYSRENAELKSELAKYRGVESAVIDGSLEDTIEKVKKKLNIV